MTRLRVARWPNGAASPVNLMIDDLADVWLPARGCRGRECDWGFLGRGPDSAWRFVEERLLGRWPDLHISLYIPVNRRPLMEPPAGSRFHPIDERPETREFLRALADHPRIECAYHGKDHFRDTPQGRLQEFQDQDSEEEAREGILRGLEHWNRVFDAPPIGGKYPGYQGTDATDRAVAKAGFRWWCRRFNRTRIQSTDSLPEELTLRWFTDERCLELPTTLAGNVLPPWLRSEWPRWPKRWWQRRRMETVLEMQVEQLLAAGLPITIQEHIAPSREDGKRQRNNLQDDGSALDWMLNLIHRHPVWHAHPSEIADHWRLRETLRLEVRGDGWIGIQAPPCDLLTHIELEILDPRIAALATGDGPVPVRDTPGGRCCSLHLGTQAFRIMERTR